MPDLLRTTADAASPRAAAWVAAVVGAALCATDTLADSPVGVGALDAPTAQAHGAGDTPAREGRPRPFGEIEARLKWHAAARSLPRGDAERQRIGKSTAIEHGADLRLMWKGEAGPLSFNVHHSTFWREGDLPGGASPGPTFDGTPAGDERRLVDLTWHLETDAGRRLLHRFDRVAAEYRTARWRIILGREAVTWGGGFFFHPMDLFNPFAPATIDQDYKPGDDLVRAERLFDGGSELEILAVGRRGEGGERDLGSASLAAKLRGLVGENEFELMASRHYGEPVFGLGLRLPAGGALLRSDVTLARPGDDVVLSGLVNADITFGIGDAPVHIFGEYFHNGFGVSRLPGDLGTLPAPLVERVGRGEAFSLMRNYLAAGARVQWHYLLSQGLSVIANLHDASLVGATHLSWDASDASRVQAGITVPLGETGDEFGELPVGNGLTSGGGARAFVRFVHYF